jgi:UbiA prenyltransferase family
MAESARRAFVVEQEVTLMSIARSRPISWMTLLRLGRVSNLPTVWTNVLAATVLAGGSWQDPRIGAVALAMSLFYLGGMYLNDYFDRSVDAHERPERPIVAGEIGAEAVAAGGFAMLAAGAALLALGGLPSAALGIALALVIVGYDVFHKGNPLAPVAMGLCRALVYCGAAAAMTGTVAGAVALSALALLAYVAGLTYAARQESLDRVGNLWPLLVLSAPLPLALPGLQRGPVEFAVVLSLVGVASFAIYLLARRPMPGAVSRAVGLLIAAISLVDAALLAGIGATVPAVLATAGFAATLLLHRYVAGT